MGRPDGNKRAERIPSACLAEGIVFARVMAEPEGLQNS